MSEQLKKDLYDWVENHLSDILPACQDVYTQYGPQSGYWDEAYLDEFKIKSIDEHGDGQFIATIDMKISGTICGDVRGFHEPGEEDPFFSVSVLAKVADYSLRGSMDEDGELELYGAEAKNLDIEEEKQSIYD